jgi:uroporphyrin-3 C-methyltransferase
VTQLDSQPDPQQGRVPTPADVPPPDGTPAAKAVVQGTAAATPVLPRGADAAPARGWLRHVPLVLALLLALAALVLAWQAHERQREVERELMRRQQALETQSAQSQVLAEKAEAAARDAVARATLLDARVGEVASQRGQLDELVRTLSRARDENVVGDVEAAVRVAYRQALVTGSVEPLVAALRQADERIVRHGQPRLDGVRRALARDLDRIQAVGVPDLGALALKLDEVVRTVDDLPLVAAAQRAAAASAPTPARPRAAAPAVREGAAKPRASETPEAAASAPATGWTNLASAWAMFAERAWSEMRSLVQVKRMDTPAAALLAPEQRYFLRENVKLRLLHARLALMSRQFDMARADVRAAQADIERYFEPDARKTQAALELLQQVAQQARDVALPRPDETLAALAAAAR